MDQNQSPVALAEDDVRILQCRTPNGDEGHGWEVFFGRSATPLHSKTKESAQRAAQQHARGHQVAVWLITKGDPDSRELVADFRRPHGKKGGT